MNLVSKWIKCFYANRLVRSGIQIGELTIWIWNDQENKDGIRNTLILHCDDIFATYNDLKAKGYNITEPELKFYGDYEMKLKDADGNLLLFLS